MLKTSGFALGFQHFPRDRANVNEWKIMFDPSIELTFFFRMLQILSDKILSRAVKFFINF